MKFEKNALKVVRNTFIECRYVRTVKVPHTNTLNDCHFAQIPVCVRSKYPMFETVSREALTVKLLL